MEPALLGLVLDSSIIIEAERKHQIVEEFLTGIRQRFGEIEITISAVTLAELVHGVERAEAPEIRHRRRAFIDELKNTSPSIRSRKKWVELADTLSGSQAAKGITLPIDDLLIGASALEQGYAIAHTQLTASSRDPGIEIIQL